MSTGVDVPSIDQQVSFLEGLVEQILNCETAYDRLEVLDAQPRVQDYLREPSPVRTFLAGLTPECELVLKSILAIGQGPVVFACPDNMPEQFEHLRLLLRQLIEIDHFYESIGGIPGYQLTVLKLLREEQKEDELDGQEPSFSRPRGLEIHKDTKEVREAIYWGIQHLGDMGEIYPVGGAGDRLALLCDSSGIGLPAALLPFGGVSLLEGLIRDLQAREYLHFKLFGKQLCTPVAMMTSVEKDNHAHIQRICEKAGWFGRSKDDFQFFQQPLVPLVSIEGIWCMRGPFQMALKPGGHGVMWMLAKQAGVLSWMKDLGREHVLVRQINNPVADTDGGTLAFTGWGLEHKKAFGFASCKRLLHTAEGVNVLRQVKKPDGYHCCNTNIEYTEFEKYGLKDAPVSPESPYSEYPANTNILFAGLAQVEKALERLPIPGMIVNFKTEIPMMIGGKEVRARAGRLESTMQNIADAIEDVRDEKVAPGEAPELQTYVTSNLRRKTISVTKRSYQEGTPLEETPDGCFAIQQQNYRELLQDHCQMTLPDFKDLYAYVHGELPFLIKMHPGIGPLYSIIGQKIRGGSLARGAELQLDLAEVDIENLNLRGSLVVRATSPLGQNDSEGRLTYGHGSGRCQLRNVRVENEGIDVSMVDSLWKNQVPRKQSLMITLHDDAEFVAENLTIRGHHHFDVPSGHRLTLVPHESGFESRLENIGPAAWYWSYRVDAEYRMCLEKKNA